MKKVFRGDNSTIAHMWANKTQSEATNGSNFYFEGDTIYSYGSHFPIAKHVINENRDRAVLFTERTYSNTTARHIQIVRQACSHLDVIYCPDLNNSHNANFHAWQVKAEIIASKLVKAKKPEKYLIELNEVKTKAKKYASFFNLPIPASLESILSIETKEAYKSYSDNKEAILAAEKKKAEAKEKKEHKKALTKWLNGETNRIYTRDGYDYLRMGKDNKSVETTQGVSIPINAARLFWQRIKDGKLQPGDEISHYTVTEIGNLVKIGCHTFPNDYLIKFGETYLADKN